MHRKQLPIEQEKIIYRAAVNVLLNQENAKEKLSLILSDLYGLDDQQAHDAVYAFRDTVNRRINEKYGDNCYDLSFVTINLKDPERAIYGELQYHSPEARTQIINFITKILNRFALDGLQEVFLQAHPDDVFFAKKTTHRYLPTDQYPEPEKLATTNLYASRMTVLEKADIGDAITNTFTLANGVLVERNEKMKLIPKKLLQPRAGLGFLTYTPREQKEAMPVRRLVRRMGERAFTSFGTKVTDTREPSRMPGNIILGPNMQLNEDDKVRFMGRIISEYNVSQVVSYEQKAVQERVYKNIKALPQDLLAHDQIKIVAQMQTPDLTSMTLTDTLLATHIMAELEKKREKNTKMYVHCKAGLSRSGTAVISAYLNHPEMCGGEFKTFLDGVLNEECSSMDVAKKILFEIRKYRSINLLSGQMQVIAEEVEMRRQACHCEKRVARRSNPH